MKVYQKQLKDIKVKNKLRGLVIFFIISLAIISGASVIALNTLNKQTKKISEKCMTSLELAEKMNVLTSDYRMFQYAHLTTQEDSLMREYEQKLESLEREIEKYSDEYEKAATTSEEKKLLLEAKKQWEAYQRNSEIVLTLSREHRTEEANQKMLGEIKDYYDDFQETYEKLVEYNERGSEKETQKVETIFRAVGISTVIMAVLVALIALYISYIVIQVIVEPLEAVKNTISEVTKGNLEVYIDYEAKDELGILSKQVNHFVEELQNIILDERTILEEMASGNFNVTSEIPERYIGDFRPILSSMEKIKHDLGKMLSNISNTVIQISSASEQMAQESEALAEGAAEQASTVEKLVFHMEDISNQTMKSEEAASIMRNIIDSVKQQAEESNEQMQAAVNAMDNITQTSQEISRIIDSIEQIASQTNLLSLNASIESARAKEEGRGFAVVAESIGELALKSSQAAHMTRELIEKSMTQTEVGNSKIKSMAGALEIMVNKSKEMTEFAEKVRKNSEIQRNAMEEIESGIEAISHVVENNAAAAQESSAASAELAENAENLKETVEIFRLSKNKKSEKVLFDR